MFTHLVSLFCFLWFFPLSSLIFCYSISLLFPFDLSGIIQFNEFNQNPIDVVDNLVPVLSHQGTVEENHQGFSFDGAEFFSDLLMMVNIVAKLEEGYIILYICSFCIVFVLITPSSTISMNWVS